jgi:glycosyltransferase involved in cell wall biosynthesis
LAGKILYVAFHFPPIQGSTGTIRTIAFTKFLAQAGWDIRVLTMRPEAYEDVAVENEALIPANVGVERAFGFDARTKVSVAGRYPGVLALPDRWQSWIFGGYRLGRRILRSWKPDVIVSTYPIPSAHAIGYLLSRRFHIPWVAEFRDPMLQDDYPSSALERIAYRYIERLVFKHAGKIIVTTPGCREMYMNRFSNRLDADVILIPNGYDPDFFIKLPQPNRPKPSEHLTLLHSGLLYPDDRNPSSFFRAVRSLKESGDLDDAQVEFRLRASGNEEQYAKIITSLHIGTLVKLLPRVPYAEAVEEIRSADALMLFQGASCNNQIPAKLYEYMYAGKPILAFADPVGDTGRLLQSVGVTSIAPLEDERQIASLLRKFLKELRSGNAYTVPEQIAETFSRRHLAQKLGEVLSTAAKSSSPRPESNVDRAPSSQR